MSVSKPSTNTQQQTQTQSVSRNLNIGDTSGITVGEAGGDVTIVSTDYNALDIASALASRSVDVGESLGHDALNLASYFADVSAQQARDVTESQADLARDAFVEVGNANSRAFQFGDLAFGTVEKALSSVGDISANALAETTDLGRSAIAGVSNAYADSATYQGKALQETADIGRAAIAGISNAYADSATYQGQALEAISAGANTLSEGLANAYSSALEFARGLQAKATDQIGSTVSALNAIAVEQNKSSDQRLAEVSGNAVKYVTVGVAVVAGAIIIATMLRSK
jgi:hypothetical protein